MDRATLQSVLTRTDERIAQAQQHVDRQRDIVADLASSGWDARRAMKALVVFEQMLEAHFAERDQLVFLMQRASA